MIAKSRLKEIFIGNNFRPSRSRGQNFLVDNNIKEKIIAKARLKPGDSVIEIGPGFGALTADIAVCVKKVVAVEKDRLIFRILQEGSSGGLPSNVELINCDILDLDLEEYSDGKKLKVVGNLPYYITSPIIQYILNNRKFIESAIITVQREVANRLLARPKSKDFASISCFVQFYAEVEYIYTVKRNSFYPAPEVDSSLLRLSILKRPSVRVADETVFFNVVRSAFGQRRKAIINSLAHRNALGLPKDALIGLLKDIGINATERPEDLSVKDFAAIADAVVKAI